MAGQSISGTPQWLCHQPRDRVAASWPGLAGTYWLAALQFRYYNEYANRYAQCLAWPVSVRHALLALLSEGPKYGLRLQQEFEERTGEVWPLNVGQVYITLQRLERDGLVESGDEGGAGPQKRFVITAGRRCGAGGLASHTCGRYPSAS